LVLLGERAIFSKNWDENMRATLIKYDNLRYRLLPYIYSLSHKVTTEGYTMMRSLAFDFADDKAIQNIPDQYMFGPAFLVNPITDPGLTSRNVYLPKATWYDFWTGKKLEGGQSINASAPIETMPLYVRAGSIIPMGPYLQYATEKQADNIELRIYRGANGEFTLYEDENETYNYEKGAFATFTFNWNDKAKTLTISDRKGEFPGMLKERTFNVVFVGEDNGNNIDFAKNIAKAIHYNGKKAVVKF
jgi:alpha-D-xyloside xylohydrolase